MDPLILLPAQYDPFLPADVQGEDRLEHVIAIQEKLVLDQYRETPRRVSPGRFPEFPITGTVRLIGYREVTQKEVDDGTAPAGTEVGDINVNTTDDELLFALRIVVADLTERYYTSTDDDIIEIDQGDRSVTFAATRAQMPSSLFRPLDVFDAREPHFFL